MDYSRFDHIVDSDDEEPTADATRAVKMPPPRAPPEKMQHLAAMEDIQQTMAEAHAAHERGDQKAEATAKAEVQKKLLSMPAPLRARFLQAAAETAESIESGVASPMFDAILVATSSDAAAKL